MCVRFSKCHRNKSENELNEIKHDTMSIHRYLRFMKTLAAVLDGGAALWTPPNEAGAKAAANGRARRVERNFIVL